MVGAEGTLGAQFSRLNGYLARLQVCHSFDDRETCGDAER